MLYKEHWSIDFADNLIHQVVCGAYGRGRKPRTLNLMRPNLHLGSAYVAGSHSWTREMPNQMSLKSFRMLWRHWIQYQVGLHQILPVKRKLVGTSFSSLFIHPIHSLFAAEVKGVFEDLVHFHLMFGSKVDRFNKHMQTECKKGSLKLIPRIQVFWRELSHVP